MIQHTARTRKDYVMLFFKGLLMGAANVIPGVSGGTIAFITGIYEELIHSIKSFDVKAFKLLTSFDVKGLFNHINITFLLALFSGIAVSILSLAKLLEYLFCHYEVLTNAFFFGLIVASVFLVGKQIRTWGSASVVLFLVGTGIALGIGFFNPASSNDAFFYLLICGVLGACSMVLPGISGSYILLIMGNYLLIMDAIGNLNMGIIFPVALGAVIGIVVFSQLLDFVFSRYHDAAVALLAGFVLGSLYIIWPWKTTIYQTSVLGEYMDKYGNVVENLCLDGIVLGYSRFFPEINLQFVFAILLVVIGVGSVLLMDRLGAKKPAK